MNRHREDPSLEYNPIYHSYLRELKLIFPHIDVQMIRSAILKHQHWLEIVKSLIDPNKDVCFPKNDVVAQKSVDFQPQTTPQDYSLYGISSQATIYDSPCKLYLPQSLISLDIDFGLFGSFDQSDLNTIHSKPSKSLNQMRHYHSTNEVNHF